MDKLMDSRVLRKSKSAPIAFVCHSLGGIIIKKLVVTAHLDRGQQHGKGELLDRIAGVVFLATPHDGSIVAGIAKTAYWFVSKSLGDLAASDAALLELGNFYRDRIANEEVVIRHRVYYEKLGMWGAKAVSAASANPGLPGVSPIPVNRDHMNICKPVKNKDLVYDDPVYEGVIAFLQDEVLQPRGPTQAQTIKGIDRKADAQSEATEAIKKQNEAILKQNEELTALVQRLVQSSTAAPAPDARESLAKTVEAAAEGAAAGDVPMRRALELLKDNRVAEAEALFREVAETSAQAARKSNREAATAYCHLGAIAALRDPKAAREAYASAVALDPENAEGLYWDGWFQLSANLAAAEKSYRALLRLAGKGASENQIFWARTGLGDIAVKRGDLSAALSAYGEGRSAVEPLAARDAGNTDWQRDLSVSNNKIGDVLVRQGNLADALNSYRAGLGIAERLAASDAGNTDWQRDLSVSFAKLALVLQSGNTAKALDFLRQGQAIMALLTKLSPDNATWKNDLAWFDGEIAEVAEQ